MPKVVVPIKEEILRATERRKASGAIDEVVKDLGELVNLGFEHRLKLLYDKYEDGKISMESFASEIGLGVRELYSELEKRDMPTSNIQR